MVPTPEFSTGPVRAAASDTIEASGSAPRAWTPERPKLTPPDATFRSEYRLLAATDESRSLGSKVLGILATRLEHIKLTIQEIATQNIQKLKESAARAADSHFWGILKKIATALLSAISIVIGVGLVATGGGAFVGGAMIASGVLSLANFALSETGAWDWVATQLSNGNEERRKMLSIALPAGVGILAGGIGIAGSIHGFLTGALQFAEQAATIAQSLLAIFNSVVTIGKGGADARLIWSQADLSFIQGQLTGLRAQFDSVMREIQGSMNDFRAVKSYTKKIVKTLSQSNIQLVRQA